MNGPTGKNQRGKGGALNSAAKMIRETQALDLRLMGLEYLEIGQKMEPPCSKAQAWRLVHAALNRQQSEGVAKLRQLENGRLNKLMRRPYLLARDPHTPDKVALKATETVAKIMERRSRLNGLDAPVQIQIGQAIESILAIVKRHVQDDQFESIATELDRSFSAEGVGESPSPEAHPIH